jgi:hypothetical protein
MNHDFDYERSDAPERLSQHGHMAGWAVFGGLVLVGFFFGIVAGYESPKPAAVARAPKTQPGADGGGTGKENPKPAEPAGAKDSPAGPPAKTPQEPPQPEPTPTPKVDPTPPPKVDTTPKTEPTPEPKKEIPKTPELVAVSFQKDVLPILRTYCLNCHGGGTGKPRGDVDLRSLAVIVDPKNPPILKPGQPEKSAIYTTIMDNAMPPEGNRPGKGERDLIRNWILGGAKPRRPGRQRPLGRRRITG